MRRRRQKNPLLMRILGISILLHLLLLPVLAHYGAFKKIQQQFVEARMVVMPAPEQEKPKAEVKDKHKVAKKTAPTAKKSAATTPHQHQAAQKSNLNQPKVVASAAAGGAGGDDGSPTVDANGSGKAGELPTQKADVTPPTVKQEETPPPVVVKKPEPPRTDPPKIAKNDTPEPKNTAPPEVKPMPKKDPVYSEAIAIDAPQPALPDDLRADDLHATFVAEFVVGMDGKPSEVKVAQSTGNNELDKLALDTARKWKFKPATRDGQPVESRVRLHIEFQVTA